jgi:hypothetical protein
MWKSCLKCCWVWFIHGRVVEVERKKRCRNNDERKLYQTTTIFFHTFNTDLRKSTSTNPHQLFRAPGLFSRSKFPLSLKRPQHHSPLHSSSSSRHCAPHHSHSFSSNQTVCCPAHGHSAAFARECTDQDHRSFLLSPAHTKQMMSSAAGTPSTGCVYDAIVPVRVSGDARGERVR